MSHSFSLVLIGSAERREQLKQWLGGRTSVTLVGQIADTHGLHLLAPLRPDIVALDCASPAINALSVLPWLSMLPGIRNIVALGANGSSAEQRLMLELGALVYVPPCGKELFLRALAQVEQLAAIAGRGDAFTPPLNLRYSAH